MCSCRRKTMIMAPPKLRHFGSRIETSAAPEKRRHSFRGERAGEVVALSFAATPASEQLRLRTGLDALGYYGDVKLTCEADGRPHDGAVSGQGFEIADEVLGDFYAVDREPPQIVEGRIAGSEI